MEVQDTKESEKANLRMKFLLLLLVLCGVNQAVVFENEMGYLECDIADEDCEFDFTVQQGVSMTYNGNFVYVDDDGNLLYKTKDGDATKVPSEDYDGIMTLDGYYRLVLTVNGKIPGPHIVVYKDQNIKVNVNNKLLSDTLSIHWHGIHQKGTPWMDGIAWVNQCPIGAGQSFSYEFKVPIVGTNWYHSHVGVQRTDGVYGGFVVKDKQTAKDVPTDIIMTVGEWEHEMAEEVFKKKYTDTGDSLEGWVAGLIEGKGRYWKKEAGKNTLIKAPLKWFTVKEGQSYRFRVIHVGSIQPLRISVDGHQLEVVATDGFDIKPIVAESFIINTGERYDFILKANQTSKNYLINADAIKFDDHSLVPHPEKVVHAVLHYEGENDTEPSSMRTKCTEENPCNVVNCQYPKYPSKENIECVNMTIKEPKEHPIPKYDHTSMEYFLNFGFPFGQAATNGRSYITPGVNSLTQTNQIAIQQCGNLPEDNKDPYYCNYEVEIPESVATVQLVLSNLGNIPGSHPHPIHLHGHSFQVLKVAFGNTDATKRLVDNQDIKCNNKYCTWPKWSNGEWGGDNIDGLNMRNPFIKDTLYIPRHGYAVVRFKADNPGKWIMHCHIDNHLARGMAVVFSEKMKELPAPPLGLPICSDFFNNPKKDYIIENTPSGKFNWQQTLIIVLGILVLLQFIVIVVLLVKRSLSKKAQSPPTESTNLLIRNTNA